MEEVVNNVLPHWPFIAAVIVFMLIGQVMKGAVFTRTAHHRLKPTWLFWWGRKTLPLHPVLAGIVLGIFWREPEPGMVRLIESIGYFALAGAISVWAYEGLKAFAKTRGIDLRLPGVEDSTPS